LLPSIRYVVLGAFLSVATQAAVPTATDITQAYADLAHASYADSLSQTKVLQQKIAAFLKTPTQVGLDEARAAWRAARVPYMQTEVFRFSNPPVDDWEGQVNAWPLDEGLIDYVAKDYQYEMGNVAATANVVANKSLKIGTTEVKLDPITPELLAELNELGGSEVNVATGFHAIEFLLWGQDLNGTKAGAGQRPFTDFVQGKGCSNGNCDRRAAYLGAVTQLLVNDLESMTTQWQAGKKDNYRAELLKQPEGTLTKMLFSMGSLALGELAGERMKVSLEANSTEDEHDCFSDNTHFSHYYNAKGIDNLFFGQYKKSDGSVVKGVAIADLVKAKNSALHTKAVAAFKITEEAIGQMVKLAEDPKAPQKFDQMVAEGNTEGAKVVKSAINALVAETAVLEEVAKALGIEHLNPDNADHEF
jgi:putative iron-regulated protein